MLVQVGQASHDGADVILVHNIFDDLIGVGHLIKSSRGLFVVFCLTSSNLKEKAAD